MRKSSTESVAHTMAENSDQDTGQKYLDEMIHVNSERGTKPKSEDGSWR